MAVTEINPDHTALIGVDLQRAFGNSIPVPHAASAVENSRLAIQHWRLMGAIVLTKHIYSNPGEVGLLSDFIPPVYDVLSAESDQSELYEGIQEEGDIVVPKTRFSAFVGTGLGEMLGRREIDTAVVCGLTTPICVESTVRDLMMRDFKVILLEDACASQQLGTLSPEDAHDSAVQTMGALFAHVESTAQFIDRTS